jgi:hypothetical protein
VFLGRVVYPGEPQWLERDALAAVWWQTEQSRRCQECGQNLDESMDKDNAYAYKAEPLWCHGCRAVHRAAVKMSGSNAKENPLAGTRYRINKVKAN